MYIQSILVMLLIFFLSSCEQIAVFSTPKKQSIPSHSKLASQSEEYFWKTLHQGDYKNIPSADKLLMAAYLQNPNDPNIAAHLGFLHIWKVTERGREKTIPPEIVNEIVLARKYFGDAVELNSDDARYLGFYGDSQLVEGKIFHNPREQTRGYFTLKKAIRDWPQFNYFTAGYVMSVLPADSKHFQEALEWQWATLDLCAGEKVNRIHPDFSLYMKKETQQGPERACWNSWIAPYNFEGFFLNMGDMLVKNGNWQAANQIYHNAKLAKNYTTWPYRGVLENRITYAKENISNFQKETVETPNKTLLFNSGYACVACHQEAR